ncbi:BTAD domain-containing putative transcriptional regulator [Actinoallomurus sp. CA-150999]|uniref:AfsR/SARP family transcriptional regulator n=1 Tax=Actinoallomurus sp. CA-150999 TaxID=3239887 RepID=UPI003D8B74FB
MEFRVLGPLEVRADDGTPLLIRQARQRALLAVLLLHTNRQMTADALVDALWGVGRPRTSSGALRTHVWAVRRLLAPSSRLHTRPSGYLLEVAPEELDLERFERLVAGARDRLDGGDDRGAVDRLQRALALWRSPPLADVPATTSMIPHLERWKVQRRTAEELLINAELRLGRHRHLLPRLRALVSESPLHEPHWHQLMRALQLSGHRGDALAAFDEAREVLKAGLGVEPGADLMRLRRELLSSPPAAGAVSPGPPRVPAALTRLSRPVPPSARAGAAIAAPLQTPYAPRDFVGRETELAEVARELTDAGTSPGVAIAVVCGRAGVGKTALATRVAHALRDRFTDGQVYVELERAHGARRAPSAVVGDVLRSLGIPAQILPESAAGRAALLRSHLADRRILLVVDDASAPEQVIPLLPGTPGAAVLVTSRRRLAGLPGARSLSLDALVAGESLALLEHIIGTRRVMAEREAAERLVRACGHLPLAIRIAGARLRNHESRPIRDLADAMMERRRLDELTVGHLSVRRELAATYSALGGEERRLFRLLGLITMHDLPEWAIAALRGKKDTQRVLEGLLDHHVVSSETVDFTGQPRYRMDPLTADYARELLDEVPAAERGAALNRLVKGWAGLVRAADHGCVRNPRGPQPQTHGPPLDMPAELAPRVRADPARWLSIEHGNLQTVCRLTCAEWRHRTAAHLGECPFVGSVQPTGRRQGSERPGLTRTEERG